MSSIPPPPPGFPPVGSTSGEVKPSRKWYWLAVVALVAISGSFGFLAYSGITGLTEDLIRVSAPGSSEVTLEEGTWTIFYEYRSPMTGDVISTDFHLPQMNGVVVADTGEEIPVNPTIGSMNYSFSDRAGYSVAEFSIDEPGDYVLETHYADPNITQPVVLALGRNKGRSTAYTVIGVIGAGAGLATALVIWLIVLILRNRNRRRAAYGV